MKFEWDRDKAALNLQSHEVSFEAAASVFGDPFAATIPDPDHSTDELRSLTMGMTPAGRLLVVVSTDRAFPNSASVNQALRVLASAARKTKRVMRRPSSTQRRPNKRMQLTRSAKTRRRGPRS